LLSAISWNKDVIELMKKQGLCEEDEETQERWKTGGKNIKEI
jgi:hypothetical protein